MNIPIGTKLVIEHIKREALWRELCEKSGVYPEDTKVYTKEELAESTKPKESE